MKRIAWYLTPSVLMAAQALAGDLHVRPTTLNLDPGQSATTLTVTNNGDTPLNAQVRVMGWNQSGGQDQLVATQTLAISPPMTTIAPHSSQSIRVVRTGKAAPSNEESYRVLVEEIADPRNVPRNGVAIQVSYSIPVFVAAPGSQPTRLSMTATRADNQLHLKASNNGGVHAQLADVRLDSGNGAQTPLSPGLLGYVLPASSREWTLPIPANAAAGKAAQRVHMRVNGQAFSVDL